METAAHAVHDVREWSWLDELERIAPNLPSLPPAAQRAVREVVAAFGREDERAGDGGAGSAEPSLRVVTPA